MKDELATTIIWIAFFILSMIYLGITINGALQ